MSTTIKEKTIKPTHQIEYWLKKIYLLERMKGRYLALCEFSAYKKTCLLQEKIVLYIQSPEYQKKSLKTKTDKSLERKNLAHSIRKQVEINQVLVEDIKNISMEYLEPLVPGYYDQEGNMKKASKIFTTDV